MDMLRLSLALTLTLYTATCFGQISKTECSPQALGNPTLTEIRPQMHSVEGKLSGFDPCHSSVEFDLPRLNSKPPLIIYVHGGGGKTDGKDITRVFRNNGVATLLFDAYEMNGFNQGWRFFSVKVTAEARQRMLFKTTYEAYKWALTRTDINTDKIYFYGLSNGAAVVANISAVVDPKKVPAVFAEGMTGTGIGLPNNPKVPIKLIYGELDNFAGDTETSWIWNRADPCILMQTDSLTPPGTATACRGRSTAPSEWLKNQESKNTDIEVWFYPNAAHWFFSPKGLNKNKITYGVSIEKFAWSGAETSAQNKLIKDVMATINQK
jgi:dienelactone hydrolase